MLTTPAMASEPYTEEAPSVSTSMRSTIAAGIALMSTPGAAETLLAGPAMRWPLTSTRVRSAPRLRSETSARPWLKPELSEMLGMLPAIAGSCCSSWPSVSWPLSWIRCRSMVITGLAVSASTRRRWLPVTVTFSSVVAAALSAVASCASAADAVAASASAVQIAAASGPGRCARRHADGNSGAARSDKDVIGFS